jgi:hypothetical protein
MLKKLIILVLCIIAVLLLLNGIVDKNLNLREKFDYDSISLGITYLLSSIIFFKMKSVNDFLKKEFTFPFAIIFGLHYNVTKINSTLIMCGILTVISIIDLLKSKNEND